MLYKYFLNYLFFFINWFFFNRLSRTWLSTFLWESSLLLPAFLTESLTTKLANFSVLVRFYLIRAALTFTHNLFRWFWFACFRKGKNFVIKFEIKLLRLMFIRKFNNKFDRLFIKIFYLILILDYCRIFSRLIN